MKRIFCLVILISSLLLYSSIHVQAEETTRELSESKKNDFIERVHMEVLFEQPEKMLIDFFDINEFGTIAIGSNSSDQKYISILTSEGNFLYALQFNSSGSFSVAWAGKDLLIYFVRSDVVVEVTEQLSIGSVYSIELTDEANQYWNYATLATERTCCGQTYSLQKSNRILDWFPCGYDTLTCIDQNGGQRILYQADLQRTYAPLLLFFGFLAMLAISCLVAYDQYTEKHKI